MQAHVHVVEFQKRGLPHAHILLILESEDKPRTTDDYDSIVQAEIPDADCFPQVCSRCSCLPLFCANPHSDTPFMT